MLCWLFRFSISSAMDGPGRVSGLTARHTRRCANCREFFEKCLSISEGLRKPPPTSKSTVSERLSERVFSVVEDRRAKVSRVVIGRRVLAIAASVAVIALAGVLFLTQRDNRPGGSDYDKGLEIVRSLARDAAGGEVDIAALPRSVEAPLAGEVESLTNRTESAVRFLVTCVAVNPGRGGDRTIN